MASWQPGSYADISHASRLHGESGSWLFSKGQGDIDSDVVLESQRNI
jgi:hypothetical protein